MEISEDILKVVGLQIDNQKVMAATITDLSTLARQQAEQIAKLADQVASLARTVDQLVQAQAPPRVGKEGVRH